jgi:hypothetical protein
MEILNLDVRMFADELHHGLLIRTMEWYGTSLKIKLFLRCVPFRSADGMHRDMTGSLKSGGEASAECLLLTPGMAVLRYLTRLDVRGCNNSLVRAAYGLLFYEMK